MFCPIFEKYFEIFKEFKYITYSINKSKKGKNYKIYAFIQKKTFFHFLGLEPGRLDGW